MAGISPVPTIPRGRSFARRTGQPLPCPYSDVHRPIRPLPHLGGVSMSVPTQLIEEYLAGPATLRKAVTGLTPEQLRARPVAGKWSTLEVVCHLVDFDPIYADRMKRIIAEERPSILGADETKFHAALCYHDRDVEEELAIL